MFIESADNKIIKQIVSLKDKKTRDADGLFIVEGEKQVNDIPLNCEVKYAVLTDNNAKINFSHVYYTTEKIFKKISDTATPQGILAVVKIPDYNLSEILSLPTGLFIIIDSLQDPGNLGTIIRTAHAYGVKGVFISKNSIDAFNGKVVRATMGSIFKVPIFRECDTKSLITEFKKNKIKTYALALETDKFVSDVKFEKKVAVIIGNESKGINADILKTADDVIKIKMFSEIDSLNAAVACSIAVYEISKQNNC